MSEKLKDQEILQDIVTICETKIGLIVNDNIAYLRLPHTTISIGDYRNPGRPKTNDMPVGDFEIFVTDWLDKEHPGYGPNAVTNYKFFTGADKIKVRRLFEVSDTNGDPREEDLELPHQISLPEYLQDPDPEFALIKRAFEGLPRSGEFALTGSPEQQFETVMRYFGGDPEETALGLHTMEQSEAEDLRSLLLRAEPTTDPYFED